LLLDYQKAKKLGERAYRRAVIRGQYPYLPALADMVKEVDRYPEIDLGRAEIPLDMIVGTRTSGRQNAFAANFMPLMGRTRSLPPSGAICMTRRWRRASGTRSRSMSS